MTSTTMTMNTPQPPYHRLLEGLPAGMNPDVTLPLESAIEAAIPLISANDRKRVHAVPLFTEWLRDRDVNLSMNNVAWLWDNFLLQYVQEYPKRVKQWLTSRNMPEVKTPTQLVAMLLAIWQAMVFLPWKLYMLGSPAGKLTYGVLWLATLLAAAVVLIPLTVLASTVLLGVLTYVAEALRHAPGLLGF